MYRGTTPTIQLVHKNREGQAVDLSTYTVYVTMEDITNTQLTFTNDRITFNADFSFQFKMTQEETFKLQGNTLRVQLRAKKGEDKIASNIATMTLEDVLYGEMI